MLDEFSIAPQASPRALKVPEITVGFWVIKILTTGLGETTSDFAVRLVDPVLAIAVAGVFLAIALLVQWFAATYSPWKYWAAVAMVAVFGTMVADAVHIGLGVPYPVSTAAFSLALIAVFLMWNTVEGTLAIHSITSRRREAFYWATIIVTFALGTAAGDMTAAAVGLGYLLSGILFAALFAVPFLGRTSLGWNETASFWAAYVLTRPLGASFADWLGVSHDRGGLGWGTGPVSVGLAVLALAMIIVFGRNPDRVRVNTTERPSR